MRPLVPIPYRSPEWYALRQDSIGGSDIGAILGCSPWQTRDGLLAAKLNPSPPESNSAMRTGSRLEVGVLAVMSSELGAAITDTTDTIWRDQTNRWHYTPDACIGSALAEAKTTAARAWSDGWGRPSPKRYRADRIPDTYLAQVQWGLMLSGLPVAYLGCLAASTDMSEEGAGERQPNLNFALYRIDPDPTLWDYLQCEARLFLSDLDAARKDSA